ncbi:beta-L-arabinofuranosidase domain-containing protein [Alicyclobacillus fodiniaquatilis]|uniref:Beta-L-arabinofuranosidase domain-containing protein n=1 Tax=Alicyclobacillus fodiniaquatilis TaxID=1661150 RepID=A0ABW4JF77_9BACL
MTTSHTVGTLQQHTLQHFEPGIVKLLASPYMARFDLNVKYLMSLSSTNLLRTYYQEAGLWSYSGSAGTSIGPDISQDHPSTWHWGWEAPTCELRGHFLGHWLSAAANVYAQTGDEQIRAKVAFIVRELARCQVANGGEWVAAFPETFMHRIAAGKKVWAPQYTVHKLFVGLYDVNRLMNIPEALSISIRFADWFYRWTEAFDREQMNCILDFETGGMLEAWANLYAATGDERHRELMYRYDRPRFFDALLRGEDVLTNKHANTQIPEILGAARVWEVTGDRRWRDVTLAFWEAAVEKRGTYCTGGVSCGEVWTPPHKLASRLGSAQEHCVVYNMMRLAEVLYRWTGKAKYADFWERNLLNGVLAQQSKQTGMVSYFLDMEPGSKKVWGSETNHFWCCHGTLVQAQASYDHAIFHEDQSGFVVSQYIPSRTSWHYGGTNVQVQLNQLSQSGTMVMQTFNDEGHDSIQHVHRPQSPSERPNQYVYELQIQCDKPTEFEIKLRVPWWVNEQPIIELNGETNPIVSSENSFFRISKVWYRDTISIKFPKKITTVPVPDQPGTVAFMDGPIVLAGLVDEERLLEGDQERPETLLIPHNERHHSFWCDGSYKTVNQIRNFRFISLMDIEDETYTVYFPIRKQDIKIK